MKAKKVSSGKKTISKELIFKALEGYFSSDEILSINEIIDTGISEELISTKFSHERAKYLSERLYIDRDRLQLTKDNNCINLFIKCNEYFENYIKNNPSFSMDDITPMPMCDTRTFGPLNYESMY